MFTRRQFIGRLVSGAAASAASAAIAQSSSNGERVIILGFDGVEPTIVDAMLSDGELPNLARLRETGCYHRLLSSNPPQSPTAWSSFATCANPGRHGIYDFLRRDPATYIPGLGFGGMQPAKVAPDGALLQPAGYVSFRKGETFWAVAAKRGLRAKLLWTPYAYPPEDTPGIQMICGLDAPDIRGTQSTFFALSDRFKQTETVAGGVRIPLRFTGNAADVRIPGLRHPHRKDYVEAPLRITVDRERCTVTLDVQGKTITVAERCWSDWIEWTFDISPAFQVRAISKCHVHEAGEHVRIYMSCLQIHPAAPYLPISAPGTYAAQLADRHGLYKTVGWSDDTKALQQDELTEALFLEEAKGNMAWQSLVVLDELEAGHFDLFIAGWTSTDRVAHMFWRYRDQQHPKYESEAPDRFRRAIETLYAQMDEIIGKVMSRITPNDTLMVLSDHGFKGFHTGFSVNTWLARNGYLAVVGQSDPATAFTDARFLQGIDWPCTKAYGLGLGSVFLNLQGREGKGTVSPDEADALLLELREKLLGVKDPESGEPVLHNVYRARDIYHGDCLADAPDLQLGFRDGYQMDKSSASGAVPGNIFAPNDDKWSGEHAAADVRHTPGILFCNRPLRSEPAIVDIGVTALSRLRIQPPPFYEGNDLQPA